MTAAKKPKKPAPKSAPKPAAGSGAVSTDDIKARFREALQHKEHHDGPDAEGSGERGGPIDTHGPASTKRSTFRRKTG